MVSGGGVGLALKSADENSSSKAVVSCPPRHLRGTILSTFSFCQLPACPFCQHGEGAAEERGGDSGRDLALTAASELAKRGIYRSRESEGERGG